MYLKAVGAKVEGAGAIPVGVVLKRIARSKRARNILKPSTHRHPSFKAKMHFRTSAQYPSRRLGFSDVMYFRISAKTHYDYEKCRPLLAVEHSFFL